MTFDEHETSPLSGRPVELYRFTLGATVYRYTSAEDEYIYGAQLYYPRLISRGAMSLASGERQQLEISLPSTDDVAAWFVGVVPGEVMYLEIMRIHRDDTDQEAIIYWDGRVTGAAYQNNSTRCVLQCATSESAFSRSIPRYKYQGLCNHMLYDERCLVDKDDFKFEGAVSVEATRSITVPGLAAAKGAAWALGGFVAIGNDYRMVIAQSGDVLSLLLDFSSRVLGQAVIVYAGCDHLRDTCEIKFDNLLQFGGFPYIPLRDPFKSGLG